MTDTNPEYYKDSPFECILLAEQCSFNVGNMCKYVWRHHYKGHPKQDLEKALWYANRAKTNREEFFGHPWHADSPNTDYIKSQYEWTTLCLIKSFNVTGTEKTFWVAMSEGDAPKAVTALKRLIEEIEE